MPSVVLISDSHGLTRGVDIPEGDILVHAGDLSMAGSKGQIEAELDWIGSLPHIQKIVIPGNHDRHVEGHELWFRAACQSRGIMGLIDEGFVTHGLVFYGSPWQPRFGSGWAYNADRGTDIARYWRKIPKDTDVLITHGPPAQWLGKNFHGLDCGCVDLLREVVDRVRPRVHVFGHIHEGYGAERHPVLGTLFVNASLVNLNYVPKNPPIKVTL